MAQPAPALAPVPAPQPETTPKLEHEGISDLVKTILDVWDPETGQALAQLVIAIAPASGDSQHDLLDRMDSADHALYEICELSTRDLEDAAEKFTRRMTRQLSKSKFVQREEEQSNDT